MLGALESPAVADFVNGIGEALVSSALALFIALFCFCAFFLLDSKLTQRTFAVREVAEEMVRDAVRP